MSREEPTNRATTPATPPARSLAANTIYAVGGTGVFHLCQLGVVVLLTKFSTPELTGQYFFALAVATPVVLLLGLELRGALVSDVAGHFSVGAYLALRTRMAALAGALLLAVAAWRALTDPRPAAVVILAGVFAARVAWSLAEVGWSTFQRRERLDLLAAAYVLRGVAALLPFAILLPLFTQQAGQRTQRGANVVALAVALHALGFLLVYYLFDRPRVFDPRLWNLSWSPPALRRLAVQTLPLGLVALFINLCDSLPRWVFDSGRVPDGPAQLGYFGALAYLTLVGNLIVIQASTAAANRLSLYYQRDLGAFLRLGVRLLMLALVIGAAVLVLALLYGRWILGVLYTADYARFETEFHIIVLAHCLALLTNVLGAAATQMRIFWIQVPIQLVTLAVTVVAAVLLIPGAHPVLGAAHTALIRAGTQFALYAGCAVLGVVVRERILKRQRANSHP